MSTEMIFTPSIGQTGPSVPPANCRALIESVESHQPLRGGKFAKLGVVVNHPIYQNIKTHLLLPTEGKAAKVFGDFVRALDPAYDFGPVNLTDFIGREFLLELTAKTALGGLRAYNNMKFHPIASQDLSVEDAGVAQ